MSTQTEYWAGIYRERGREAARGNAPLVRASGRSDYGPEQVTALIADAEDALRLKPTDHLLDVGCAAGLMGLTLRRTVARYVGVDACAEMLERAAREMPGAELILASAVDLPFPDASFDAVLLSSVLLLLSEGDGEDALREARRVVRPGGRAFVSGNPETSKRGASLDPEHVSETTWREREDLCAVARACGWARAEARDLSPVLPQSGYQFDMVVWA